MKLRVLSEADVRRLLPMRECIDVVAAGLAALARGNAEQPLRTGFWLPDRSGLLGMMPGYLGEPRAFGLKLVSVMPGNHALGKASHQGIVALFDPDHGEPLVVIDAASITEIRTGAASAVATRLLAREESSDLAILGSGAQARSHLAAMRAVRPIRRVRVWSRDADGARRFATVAAKGGSATDGERHPFAVEAVGSAREAVVGADLICTTTAAREPILEGAWLAPGAHVNAVGACFPTSRELDTAAVRGSRLFVDRRESALREAGDILIPMKEGAFGEDQIAGEIGDLLLGRLPGRRSPVEITLFKSLGIAVEDLAVAVHLLGIARESGAGTEVDL